MSARYSPLPDPPFARAHQEKKPLRLTKTKNFRSAGTIGAIDPFMGGVRSVAVVPTVSFGGAPRVLPTGPVGGIIGPYGRPAPIGGGVGVSRTTVVNRGAGVSGVIRPGGRGPVNRPNRRGRLLQTATIV